LKPPYRLDGKPLGVGSYATVTRGEHKDTGRIAAIKRPRGDPESKARFAREFETQKGLDHPNVMPILEGSVADGWFAMPLATRTLTKAVEKDRDVGEFQAGSILRDIVRALEYAHTRGFVHRDVNPNNILELVEDGDSRWVLGDWGLVGVPDPGTARMTRRPLGTDGFIAPEVELNPLIADATSDVFSLGRVAHFTATRVWPRRSFPMPHPGALWETLVESCTAERDKRVQAARDVLPLIRAADAQIRQMENRPEELLCPRCDLPMDGARCPRCGRFWD
jgi:serine/threonine protein kinase